ncbi:hypothetical protein HYN48_14080 [Flavobacterium magnum]|uniref:Uncharacterized protein n=2 Tax=Flavobacterium magnum TaxID=2162713 RepID=A0A2S0RIT5_9FLAO|nr:hypothetical protein HYN48_14080 [Flavobacterium magnum]
MVIVKRLENESFIFAITDRKRNILYQQSLVETFSELHYWLLYADDKQNIYYYNSDYSSQKALLFDAEKKEYNAIDFCTFEINLPKEFKKKLADDTNLGNCISLR